ncbi:helix-turn-helix domain-containing protein [Sphingomonas sp.]|uniref:helix-turn-helix domain-containing protein n=1 Tax=Sphingomonas sp. TaxID=28214 RepID=UPI003BA8D4C2
MIEQAVPDTGITEPAAFTQKLSSLFHVGFIVEPTGPDAFQAVIKPVEIGRLNIAQLSFSPHKTRRSITPVAHAREYFLLNHLIEGSAWISQDGREAEVAAGDLYLINTMRDFNIETGSMRANSVYIDAAYFRSVYPEIDCCLGVRLDGNSSTTRIVVDLLSRLFDMALTLTPDVADRFADAIPHLLAIALSAREGSGDICPSSISLFHKERVKSFVRKHLANPDLSCKLVSDELRLSQRYIYDIFADEPMTLMRWVRVERLARCHRELSTPALARKSVSEIAFSWGFIDLAHFSRSFSSTYGVSPRAFRQRILGELAAAG